MWQYSDVVMLELYGHYHFDLWKYSGVNSTLYTNGFVNPSISPRDGNNPGFRILNLNYTNEQWVLQDF